MTPDAHVAFSGARSMRLTHAQDADSRVVQHVRLLPRTSYRFSTYCRTENVGLLSKGAHLCLMDNPVESNELRGTRDWTLLRFYVLNGTDAPLEVTVAARLGTYGQMNTGQAWFDDIEVVAEQRNRRDIPLFVLPPESTLHDAPRKGIPASSR